MTDPLSSWMRCPSCGSLVAEAHLATMVVRGCPSCGKHDLEHASPLHSRLAASGAVRITTKGCKRKTA